MSTEGRRDVGPADGGGGAGGLNGNPTFGNPAWEEAPIRVLVVRLSPLGVAERSSTHLFLSWAVRQAVPDAYIDMLFVPPPRRQSLGGPAVRSLHAGRGPGAFDLLLVSASYLLELLNVPPLLECCGPSRASPERVDHEPIIILGGASAMAAHPLVEPGGAAGGWVSGVDGFFFGEGEREVGRIAATVLARHGVGRRAVLDALAHEIPALWVLGSSARAPDSPVRRAVAPEIGPDDVPTSYPILDGAEASTARLQITYGCPALCSFCFESYDRRPYREVPFEVLREAARELKRNTGAERLELFSFNFSYHSAFPALVRELAPLYAGLGFMSQRVDVLARSPELLAFEIAAGKRSYTLGIEGISSRLRAFLQKGVAREELDGVVAELIRRGVREMKLFYIITGYEEEADLAELDSFLGRLPQGSGSGAAPRLILSFTYLLRMPFTPLRYDAPLLDRERADAIVAGLRRLATARHLELRLAGAWEEHVTCQLLALAGYGAAGLLSALAREGIVYDGRLPDRAWGVVEQWTAANRELVEALGREKEQDQAFPFAFVAGAPEAGLLYGRYREARAALAGAVPGAPFRFARRHTGLDVSGMQELVRSRELRERGPLFALVDLPRETAAYGPEWRSAWIMRQVFRIDAGLIENLLRVEEILVSAWPDGFPRWYGRGVVRVVAWDTDGLAQRVRSGLPPFVGLCPQAERGVVRELEGRIELPGASIQSIRRSVADFLRSIHCAVVTVREGESYMSTASAESRRRKSLLSGRLSAGSEGVTLTVRVGARFPMRRFLRSLSAEMEGSAASPAGGGEELAVEVTGLEV